ncbi:MAG: gfo/Idh/MocA family oxidoreductase, partial [Casimicrobiaceae bacterium]
AARPSNRPQRGVSAEAELRAKEVRGRTAIPARAPHQPFFGLTVVSCEGGDIRQSPQGLLVYRAAGAGVEEIVLPTSTSPRDLVVAEFHDALTGTRPALHDGRWGLANLEVCVAAIASSQSGREVLLEEQVSVPG